MTAQSDTSLSRDLESTFMQLAETQAAVAALAVGAVESLEAIADAARETFTVAFLTGEPLPPPLAKALQAMHERIREYDRLRAEAQP